MGADIPPASGSGPSDEAATETKARADGGRALPQATRSYILSGIFTLMVFYTLYFTAELVIPLVFAVLLKLLLQPGLRLLLRLRIPQPISALLVILLLCGGVGAFGYAVAGPAATWLAKAPASLPRLEDRLTLLRRPLDEILSAAKRVEEIAEPTGMDATPVTVRGPTLSAYLFSGTRSLVTGLGLTLLLLFFLLAAGDLFLRKLVEILPTFGDKKQAVEMSYEIEHSISAYLLTISIMNALVGLATGGAMYAIGLPDPALWAALAFALNYVLILGPLAGVVMFFMTGLLSFDLLWQALLPPAAYLAIHIIEGEVVTPMLVARRFILNPVLVIGAIVFWNWMWGISGAFLAVPMLATFKIVCDRVRPLAAIGHFIGG